MTEIYNKVLLKGNRGRTAQEAQAASGSTIKPGHLCEYTSAVGNKMPKVQSHSIRGGRARRLFALEDVYQGKTIDDVYTVGAPVFLHDALPGDWINALLAIGENVDEHDYLVSAGDGTFIKTASEFIANALTVSNTITNTSTETTFTYAAATNGVPATGLVALAANTLRAGDVLHIHGTINHPSTNSTNTCIIKVYIGSQVLMTSATLDMTNNDITEFDVFVRVRTAGASGTAVADGTFVHGVPNTNVPNAIFTASFTLDTTAATTVKVTHTMSAASTSNQSIMQAYSVRRIPSVASGAGGGDAAILEVQSAVDNSAGSAAVRVIGMVL